jgi:hypothetical protein
MTVRSGEDMTRTALAALVLIALQAGVLLVMGHPTICKCGFVTLWYGSPAGPETSQQLTDWYSFTHVEHGFLFYLLLWAVAPRLPVAARFLIATGIEGGWEILENTPFIINRYRETALAQGYFGDSVANSLTDTLCMMFGFFLARRLPVWASAGLVVGTETALAILIRDNLALNIVQLLFPSDALSRWQAGG